MRSEALEGVAFRWFLLHSFFRDYSLHLFTLYGSLLVYLKTQSVAAALVYSIVGSVTVLAMQTLFLRQYLGAWNALSLRGSMLFGLVTMAGAYLALFFLPAGFPLLIALAALFAIGANFYYMPFHVVKFVTIGESLKPGRYASLFLGIGVLAGIAAALTGLTTGKENFLVLILVAGLLLVAAAGALLVTRLPHRRYHASFPAYFRSIPLRAHFSYSEFSHEMMSTVVPLIVFFMFRSLTVSVWVSTIAALGTVAGIWVAGLLRDKGNPSLVLLASVTIISCWVLYAIVRTPLSFGLIGLAIGVASAIVGTSIDAALGRDVVNAEPLSALFAVEFTKHATRILALCVALVTYWMAGALLPAILLLGALFELPRIYYALSRVPAHVPEPVPEPAQE